MIFQTKRIKAIYLSLSEHLSVGLLDGRNGSANFASLDGI